MLSRLEDIRAYILSLYIGNTHILTRVEADCRLFLKYEAVHHLYFCSAVATSECNGIGSTGSVCFKKMSLAKCHVNGKEVELL